jgi:hypothetical protein
MPSVRRRVPAAAAVLVAALLAGQLPGEVAAAGWVPTSVTVSRSGPVVSGSSLTFTPVFDPAPPDAYVFPASTVCSWELLWGDDASLVDHHYDATFGSMLVRGKGSDGYCAPWTFTLPYSASGRWEWAFGYGDGANGAATPYTFMTGTTGVAAGGITDSSLPGVWLSMPSGTRIGDLVTATAHAFGGYVIPPNGAHWTAASGCDCQQPFAKATNHSLAFTFRAAVAGTIIVFFNDSGTPEYGGPNFAGAGIDPKVIAFHGTISVPTTIHRNRWFAVASTGSGFVGTVHYAWYVDGVPRFSGRTGHVRFSRLGWHTIKVVLTDRHGHRVSRVVSRFVRP